MGGFVQTVFQDLRYGTRMLMKNPGLTIVVVLSLAIGIGANTALFSVTSTLLLKPLPYPHPDRLAILWLRSPGHRDSAGLALARAISRHQDAEPCIRRHGDSRSETSTS